MDRKPKKKKDEDTSGQRAKATPRLIRNPPKLPPMERIKSS